MLEKGIVIIAMIMIIVNLARGLVFLIQDAGKSKRTVRALSWRITLSLLLFAFLMIGFASGIISPHGLVR